MGFLNLGQKILDEGEWVENERTGVRCKTIIGHTMEIGDEIPLLTTKQSFPVSAIAEIVGYLRGYTNAQDFANIQCPTWFVNANETQAWLDNPNREGEDDMGKVYGAVARDFGGLDLVYKVYNNLMKGIDDRGETITFWKPDDFDKGCLRPCMRNHTFSILGDKLYLESESRSVDYGCGLNFNSIQAYFLLKVMCHFTGYKFGRVRHNLINVHIYEPHIKGVEEQLSRKPLTLDVDFSINGWVESMQDITECHTNPKDYFKLEGYGKDAHLGKIPFKLIA
ncbi:MAG: hypothetical protein GY928_18535 [Colwellia sp.]|nr:hypothetical protein [Colwellia sp.]